MDLRLLLAVAGMVLIAPSSVLFLVGWFSGVDRLLARRHRASPRLRPYPYPVLATGQRVPPAGEAVLPVPHDRGRVVPMTARPYPRLAHSDVDPVRERGLNTTHLAGGSGVPPVAITKHHVPEDQRSANTTTAALLGVSPGS